jgi:hypothetical protein
MADRAAARGRRRKRIPIGPFGFRAGSLPDRLLRWARARGRPFRVAEVADTLRVNRAHAQRLLVRARAHLRHLAYGVHVAAQVYRRATPETRREWHHAVTARPASFRPGSLADRFARWAAARSVPFRPRDAARALGMTAPHALQLTKRALAKVLVERLAWGTYVGPGARRSATRAWHEEQRRHPFRAGSTRDRLLRWAAGRRRPFAIKDAAEALGVAYHNAWGAISVATLFGLLDRIAPGTYAAAGTRAARRRGRRARA